LICDKFIVNRLPKGYRIHEIEPELQQTCPRATKFDGTYGDLHPLLAITIGLLFCGALCYLVFTRTPDSFSDGFCLLLVAAILASVIANILASARIRKLVEQGTATCGRITKITQRVGKGGMVDDAIYYMYEGREANVKPRLGRRDHKLSPYEEVTILWHPQYGDAIYKLCCYKAVTCSDKGNRVSG
jgi:hypothetical protein